MELVKPEHFFQKCPGLAAKKIRIVKECWNNFKFIPCNFRMEASEMKWSSFWWRNFKMFGSCQSFLDSSNLFVSGQGFQWVQKIFFGTLPSMQIWFFQRFWALNQTKIAKIRSEKAGLRGGVLDAQGEDQGAEIYPRVKVVNQTSDRLICYMIQRCNCEIWLCVYNLAGEE